MLGLSLKMTSNHGTSCDLSFHEPILQSFTTIQMLVLEIYEADTNIYILRVKRSDNITPNMFF